MTLAQITEIANSYTDENFTTTQTFSYANTAISKINTKIKSILPFFSSNPQTAYTSLSDDWIMLVIIPHVCWSIKMNDGSLNEAREYLFQFETGLRTLEKNKKTAIAIELQGSGFKKVYPINRYAGMPKTSAVVGVSTTHPLGEEEE